MSEARIPLGVGALFTQSFTLFMRHFALFVAITGLPSLLMAAISASMFDVETLADPTSPVAADPLAFFTPGYLVFVFASTLVGFLIMGVVTLAAYDARSGKPVRIGDYVARTLSQALPLVVLTILMILAFYVGVILLIVPGLYIAARFAPLVPSILVEGTGWSGLGRAQALTKDYRWPIVGALILLFVILVVVSAGLAALLFFLAAFGFVGEVLLGTINSVASYGFGSVFTALLYARLREIKEGLGIEDLSAVFE